MIGYSEILQTMVAMILFSMILISSNRVILLNSQQGVQSQIEKRAVAIAQSYIDEARVRAFDAATYDPVTGGSKVPDNIPEDFTSSGPGTGENTPADFNDFDDYHGWSDKIDWIPGSGENEFQVDIEVLYVDSPNFAMSAGSTTSQTVFKKMVVTVTSDYLKDGNGDNIEIQIPYLRRYYKQ